MKEGKVWKFGDNIDTDAIIPGRHLTINDSKELSKYAFESILPEFAQKVRSGDIIVAGRNFGCGSSREHAPLALKGAGISCIIAKSFARIFFRNAINIGLPVLECDEIDQIEEGNDLKVDIEKGMIQNLTKDEKYPATPLPEFVRKIIDHGGLIGYTKNILRKSH